MASGQGLADGPPDSLDSGSEVVLPQINREIFKFAQAYDNQIRRDEPQELTAVSVAQAGDSKPTMTVAVHIALGLTIREQAPWVCWHVGVRTPLRLDRNMCNEQSLLA